MVNGFHRGVHPRSLDEVAIATLAASLDADDTLVDVELVEVDLIEDLDVTARFTRESAPYERIEITTIANLMTTVPFQTVEVAPAEVPEWRATSWRWIAYSGAAWALAIAVWWIGKS